MGVTNLHKQRNADLAEIVERLSIGNLKQTWVAAGQRNWADPVLGEGRELLRHKIHIKSLWIPYGE